MRSFKESSLQLSGCYSRGGADSASELCFSFSSEEPLPSDMKQGVSQGWLAP